MRSRTDRNSIFIAVIFIALMFGMSARGEDWEIKNKAAVAFKIPLSQIDGIYYVSMKDMMNVLKQTDSSSQMLFDDQFGALRIKINGKSYSFFKDKPQLVIEQNLVQSDYPLKIIQGQVLIPVSSVSLLNQYAEIFDIGALPVNSSAPDAKIEPKPDVVEDLTEKSAKQEIENFSMVFDAAEDNKIVSGKTDPKTLSSKEILKKALLESPSKTKRIYIEPDYFYPDSEKTRIEGFSPLEITLNIANRIKQVLSAGGGGIEVVIADKSLSEMPLEQRINKINSSGADIFIALGCDFSNFEKNAGMQIYTVHSAIDTEGRQFNLTQLNKYAIPDYLSYLPHQHLNLILCSKLFDEIKNNVPVEAKGVRLAPLYMLKRSAMPSAYLLLGYANNPKDVQLMKNPSFQEIVARSVAGAILKYSNFVSNLD